MAWITALYLMDRFLDWLGAHFAIVRREIDLFLGLVLVLVPALNLHAGRYCDGNSADYLSCTRPAVYYYYNGFDVALIVAGIFLVVLWLLARRRA